MPEGIADKFTNHQPGVTSRSLVNACFGEVTNQAATSHADARGLKREQLRARRIHLHSHPAPPAELNEPGISGMPVENDPKP